MGRPSSSSRWTVTSASEPGGDLGARSAEPSWVAALEAEAPDVVGCWRVTDYSRAGVGRLRRELGRRVFTADAPRIMAQQEAVARALAAALAELPDELLRAPGGEEDWNVAQTFAHATAARRFLASWAALDAGGEPVEDRHPPVATPSVAGPPQASREDLLLYLDKSTRAQRQAADRIEGHELQPCFLEHPLIGRLRCGDWLLFVGVHDLMHLEQLHRLAGQG